MLGWEFPPFNRGGLGVACYGLAKGLHNQGVDITLVLPKKTGVKPDFFKLISTDVKIDINVIDSPLTPYMTSQEYEVILSNEKTPSLYGKNLFEEVKRYTAKVKELVKNETFDVIHAHDWMTYQAGIEIKKMSNKPLVVHMHATEFDRTGGNGINQYVYDLERAGMNFADAVIPVSNFTKNMIMQHYGIPSEKIHPVHNAVEFNDYKSEDNFSGFKNHHKIVLSLGRITLQKGVDYFLYAAKQVLDYDDSIRFVIAGSGDMERFLIEKAAEMGIADKVLFTGWLRGEDIDRAFQMADLYVMPSVSEPFGIAPLEAIRNNTPVIISKQSGVSEVLNHCLKVDFWDVNELANKILSVLRYSEVHESLRENGSKEVKKFNWNIPAKKCIEVYNKVRRYG